MAIDFKYNETLIPVNQNQNQNRSDSGSDSAFFGSWGSSSSSSFLTASFGSEFDSNDADLEDGAGAGAGEDDEFIAQLTRQMADYMLEDDDDSGGDEISYSKIRNPSFQEPVYDPNHEETRRSYADTVKKSIVGFQPEQSFSGEKQSQPPIQMYQVENQPRVGGGRRGGKMSESTHQMKHHRHEQVRGFRGSKDFVNGGKGYSSTAVGSGMRAIFLGGSGSRNVISGTGVFLPRSSTDATDQGRKKPGCSTVLVPTRVLQALEQHFNNMESLSPSSSLPKTHRNHQAKKDKSQTQESVSVDHQEPKLPQEWIY